MSRRVEAASCLPFLAATDRLFKGLLRAAQVGVAPASLQLRDRLPGLGIRRPNLERPPCKTICFKNMVIASDVLTPRRPNTLSADAFSLGSTRAVMYPDLLMEFAASRVSHLWSCGYSIPCPERNTVFSCPMVP